MNKKKIGIGLVSILTAAGLLAGCGSDENEGGVAVESVQLKGIYDAYSLDDVIDWSGVTVVVKYADKTSVTISAADIEFDVETAVNANTKAIINTNGLHGLTELTEHEYQIKVVLVSDGSKSYDAGLVSVGDITPEKFSLISFAKPDFISTYEATKANAGKTPTTAEETKTAESWFKKGGYTFTVGTLNTFKFVPTALFTRKNDLMGDVKASNSYKKIVTLEVNSGGEYSPAAAQDYSVVREGVKFNDSAVGKQFKMTVKPEHFAVENPAVFEFKVEKGLNIHNAKELGAINLTSVLPSDNLGTTYYENFYASKDRGNDPIFPNASNTGQERRNTVEMWENFLKSSGTFTEAEIAAYKDAPGYFLINPIKVTPEDIPSEFFIKDGEYNNTNNIATGSLRDNAYIYHIIPKVEKLINGNYFTVDASNIPLCMSTASGGGLKVIDPTSKTVDPGHACLFYASGKVHSNSEGNNTYFQGSTYESGVKAVEFRNLNIIGNTGTDLGHTKFPEGSDENFKKMAKLTGLIGIKCGALPNKVDNCIVKQCMIGVFSNCNLALTGGEVASKVLNSRIYDCANSGSFNYQNQSYLIDNTELKRFGGSAIFNVGHATKKWYGGVTNVNSNCTIENKITGEEVYFTAVGAAVSIGTLKAMNGFFKAPFASAPFVSEDGFIDCISITMEDGYMGSEYQVFHGKTVLNAETANTTAIDLGDMTNPGGQLYSMVHEMLGSYAPVCTFDGSITFDPQMVDEMTKRGSEAAAVVVFNDKNPTDITSTIIPSVAGLGGDYTAGVYVPVIGQAPLPNHLASTTAYTGSNMHLCVPVASTTLSLILGL